MGRTPDFFLVGAAKSGTTAMHQYLRAHPDIYMPARKEPHYFGRDIRSPRFVNDRREYLRLFAGAREEKAVGEASVWYLVSKHAAEEIRDFRPDARIVIMLREPVDLLRSLHAHNVANGVEDITDLGKAIDARVRDFSGRIAGRPAVPEFLTYLPVGRFASQIERYRACFPPDRIRVILYEEFAADPAAAYSDLLRFLGVDPDLRPPTFKRINEARRSRSRTIARWLHAPPPVAQRIFRTLLPKPIRQRFWHEGVRPILQSVNSPRVRSAPLDPALRARLRAYYRDEIPRVAALIGRPDLMAVWGYADADDQGYVATPSTR
jgi:Sulfotransferase domain